MSYMDNLRDYANAWRGNWVVAANRSIDYDKLEAIKQKYPEDSAERQEAINRHRYVECNLSADFDNENSARLHAMQCIANGANYIVVMSPEVFTWALDDADKHNTGVRLAGEHIKWLSGDFS